MGMRGEDTKKMNDYILLNEGLTSVRTVTQTREELAHRHKNHIILKELGEEIGGNMIDFVGGDVVLDEFRMD